MEATLSKAARRRMRANKATRGAQPATLVWLRNELRTHDNYLLQSASKSGGPVMVVYVFDPLEVGENAKSPLSGEAKTGARRAKFLLESVSDLRKNLRQSCGSDLIVARAPPESVIPPLVHALGRETTVVCAQSVCSEEQQAEARVEKALGTPLQRVWENTMYQPDDLAYVANIQMPQDVTDVCTPWRQKVEKNKVPIPPSNMQPLALPSPGMDTIAAALEAASNAANVVGLGPDYLPTLADLGVHDEREAEADQRGDFFNPEGGETAALARLKRYVWDEDRLKTYFETRNGMVGQGYSTKLAPWLARGCISPRFVANECRRYERERGISNKSTYWVIFELTVRDYFIYYAQKYGRRLFYPYGVKGKRGSWRKDPGRYEAWKQGRTGVPLIDANMRELAATGFMSNRGRQNVASFLIFNLGIDWRLGAEYFEEMLVDYTPEANWGNWHAAAGLSGGRLNRFNAVKQAKDYDARGDYVKLWCPELSEVPITKIASPWTMSEEEQRRAGCILGSDYPLPLVPMREAGPRRDNNRRPNYAENRKAGGGRQSRLTESWGKLGQGPDARASEKERNRQRSQKKSRVQGAWNAFSM